MLIFTNPSLWFQEELNIENKPGQFFLHVFKAYNFRSDIHSIFRRPFANKWLNMAVAWEMVLLVLIIYVPFLQKPFSTHPLSYQEWILVIVAAATVIPVLEITKWFLRKSK